MKTEINLRPRAFVVSREFYWPRVLGTLAGLLLILAVAGGSVLLYLYQVNLEAETALLRGNVEQLRVEAAPIAAIEEELRSFKDRAQLKDRLIGSSSLSWSGMLQEVDDLAERGAIDLEHLAGSAGGGIVIRGNGLTMRGVAAFLQDLEKLNFLRDVVHLFISLNTMDRFGFEAKASLTDGGSK